MNIVAFVGSPRKGGNTDILMEAILEGARSAGASTKKVFVYDLNHSGCIACGGCKSGDSCVLNDDMTPLYDEIQKADVVVLGSPIYMGRITGPLISFFDRWYALIDRDFNTRIKPGKKIAAVSVCAAPVEMFAGETEYLISWCERWGMKGAGSIEVGDVAEAGDIKLRTEVMEKARKMGTELAG